VTIDRVCAAADAAYAARAADRAARRAAAAADAADAIAVYDAAVGAVDAADAIADGNCAAMCDLIRAIIPCPPTGAIAGRGGLAPAERAGIMRS
jgi:hypothetical protein